jgi:hypothetical protein
VKEQDRNIGKFVFGWTDEETEENVWYDQFFEVWRPKPNYHKDLYPSWSESNDYAMQLIAHLVKTGLEIEISAQQDYHIEIIGPMYIAGGDGITLPHALADALAELEVMIEPIMSTLIKIREVV